MSNIIIILLLIDDKNITAIGGQRKINIIKTTFSLCLSKKKKTAFSLLKVASRCAKLLFELQSYITCRIRKLQKCNSQTSKFLLTECSWEQNYYEVQLHVIKYSNTSSFKIVNAIHNNKTEQAWSSIPIIQKSNA